MGYIQCIDEVYLTMTFATTFTEPFCWLVQCGNIGLQNARFSVYEILVHYCVLTENFLISCYSQEFTIIEIFRCANQSQIYVGLLSFQEFSLLIFIYQLL